MYWKYSLLFRVLTCTGQAAPSPKAQIVWPSICLLSSWFQRWKHVLVRSFTTHAEIPFDVMNSIFPNPWLHTLFTQSRGPDPAHHPPPPPPPPPCSRSHWLGDMGLTPWGATKTPVQDDYPRYHFGSSFQEEFINFALTTIFRQYYQEHLKTRTYAKMLRGRIGRGGRGANRVHYGGFENNPC